MTANSTLYRFIAFSLLTLLFCLPAASSRAGEKIIIAGNGAGQEFIEHSLPAVTLAIARDVDFIQLHVVMTSDNQPVVFHDLTLNRLTDVAALFPDRSRDDGSHYVIDFSLKEIRQLRLKNNLATEKYPLSFAIPTLGEELSLIRRLESILDKSISITLEIRRPWFHLEADSDISSASLDVLMDHGYVDNSSTFFIQCFDPEELQRIYAQLMPERGMNLPLIQLIGSNDGTETQRKAFDTFIPYNYDWLYTHSGLKVIAGYAAVIGLSGDVMVDPNGTLLLTDYITTAHEYGLSVFVSSLDNRPGAMPTYADTFQSLLTLYLEKAGIDGFYTNSFSEAKSIINRLEADKKRKDALPEFFSSLNLSPPSNTNEAAPPQINKESGTP